MKISWWKKFDPGGGRRKGRRSCDCKKFQMQDASNSGNFLQLYGFKFERFNLSGFSK